jgi:hypothetical protein
MIARRNMLKISGAIALAIALPRPSNATPLKLAFVHGIGQGGFDPIELKATWYDTLKEGAASIGTTVPAGLEITFPYYGKVLDDLVRRSKLPRPSEIHSRGDAPDQGFLDFQGEVVNEIRLRKGITDDQINAELDETARERGPQNWQWVQAIIRAFDRHLPKFSQDSLEVFLRDVYLYTTNSAARDEIDAIVANELTRQPTVIVGHSLGSVVAYNVLASDGDLNVPLYVTLGSPLGINAIKRSLSPINYPKSVATWFNAFDPRDVVALYPLDTANFPVTPLIENYGGVNNATDNRHGIIGYLNDKTVAERILRAVGT